MLNTFAWFGFSNSMEERLTNIKKAGFDGVTLWWSDDNSAFGNDNYRNNPEIARKIGLSIEGIHASFQDINNIWLDNLAEKELTDYYIKVVKDCAKENIPSIVMHLTGADPPPFNTLGLSRIRKIVDAADNYNIKLALENLRRLNYLDYVLQNITSSNLGFCYDSGHHNCMTPNIDLLSLYGNRLFSLHLHDNDGINDLHSLPFDGTIDWNIIMDKLAKLNYKSPLTLEATNLGYENFTQSEFLKIAFERSVHLENMYLDKFDANNGD